jgi:hypothetical protein
MVVHIVHIVVHKCRAVVAYLKAVLGMQTDSLTRDVSTGQFTTDVGLQDACTILMVTIRVKSSACCHLAAGCCEVLTGKGTCRVHVLPDTW